MVSTDCDKLSKKCHTVPVSSNFFRAFDENEESKFFFRKPNQKSGQKKAMY